MATTAAGVPLISYHARFSRRDAFDRVVIESRNIAAVNDFQAHKKAEGIAKKNGWKLVSVGRA